MNAGRGHEDGHDADESAGQPERTPPGLRRFLRSAGWPTVAATAGFVAAVVAVGAVVVAESSDPAPDTRSQPRTSGQPLSPGTGTETGTGPGPKPEQMALVAFDSCEGLLDGLRDHAARNIETMLPRVGMPMAAEAGPAALPATGDTSGAATAAGARAEPDYSTTNVHEVGVDEPDIVKTDGSRIVSVMDGVLRVVDAKTKEITGSLDLTIYAGWESAQLFLSGDRVLVMLASPMGYPGPIAFDTYPGGGQASGRSTYLLVDVSAAPRVVENFRPTGNFLDARMIGSTVRLVVVSSPRIPIVYGGTPKAALSRNKQAISEAPLSAWLPSYQVSDGTATTSHTVPCRNVSHPDDYSGASMLTMYTLDLDRGLDNPSPVSVAADGSTVYASAQSLYVASNQDWFCCTEPNERPKPMQVHRFDISGAGAPDYLGSGTVPGRLLNQYSMSEYDGYLRVATTSGMEKTSSSVFVLDADTLEVTGQIGGLGVGEQIYAVRFLGPLGYVVTFRQVDPLYVIDLRDPTAPRKAGELKVTGYSDYLHPVGDGRLVGVGQEATTDGRTTGLQVSLFDVSSPADPQRLDRIVRRDTQGGFQFDPHAFLYWPQTNLLVLPVESWDSPMASKAMVLRVSGDALTSVGTITSEPDANGNSTIRRSIVIGDDLWTLSGAGLKASDADTLTENAWVPFGEG